MTNSQVIVAVSLTIAVVGMIVAAMAILVGNGDAVAQAGPFVAGGLFSAIMTAAISWLAEIDG